MRLWSLSPKYLDVKGLLAVWRETLLAKKVLEGKTKGYKNHPQLIRFREYNDSLNAINSYLHYIFLESEKRDYSFDKTKISKSDLNYVSEKIIQVTEGQIKFEFEHLLKKLQTRDIERYKRFKNLKLKDIEINQLFKLVKGKMEKWEKNN